MKKEWVWKSFLKRVMGVVKRACHGKPSVNNCMIVFVLLTRSTDLSSLDGRRSFYRSQPLFATYEISAHFNSLLVLNFPPHHTKVFCSFANTPAKSSQRVRDISFWQIECFGGAAAKPLAFQLVNNFKKSFCRVMSVCLLFSRGASNASLCMCKLAKIATLRQREK